MTSMARITPKPRAGRYKMLFITALWCCFDRGLSHEDMQVNITIGVQKPELVDTRKVADELPRGQAIVTVVKGGLNVHDTDNGTLSVIATAAVEACLDIYPDDWQLSR